MPRRKVAGNPDQQEELVKLRAALARIHAELRHPAGGQIARVLAILEELGFPLPPPRQPLG